MCINIIPTILITNKIMAMLKREITAIVTMINRMLQARSLHGHIMEKQHINV